MKATGPNTPPTGILLVVQTTQMGGMETYVQTLAREFVTRGLRVTAVVPDGEMFDAFASGFRSDGSTVVRMNTDGRRGRLYQVRDALGLARLLVTRRPSVVHLHTGGTTGGFAVLAMARLLTRGTVILTEHDVPAAGSSGRQRLAKRASERMVHAVAVGSRKLAGVRAERLIATGPNVVSVPIGIQLEPLDEAVRARNRRETRSRLELAEDVPVIGLAIRLAQGKGVDTLIRAFALVRAEHPCKLLLVGDGALRAELEQLSVALGCREDIIFAGHQDDPRPFYDGMDIFANAVPVGSGSMALMEAMARGVPGVITFGGPEEAVVDGWNGYAVPPDDPPALAAALRHLVIDPALREMFGKRAAEHIRSAFSMSRVADDLLELYSVPVRGVPARLRADRDAGGAVSL